MQTFRFQLEAPLWKLIISSLGGAYQVLIRMEFATFATQSSGAQCQSPLLSSLSWPKLLPVSLLAYWQRRGSLDHVHNLEYSKYDLKSEGSAEVSFCCILVPST